MVVIVVVVDGMKMFYPRRRMIVMVSGSDKCQDIASANADDGEE